MYSNTVDSLLKAILNCGSMDLEMLNDVKYDFDEIIEQLDDEPLQNVGFNGFMRAVVDVGIIYLQEAIDDRICELEAIYSERDLEDEEEEELAVLRRLDPNYDIEAYFNCLDTRVYFLSNEEAYRTYMADALDSFAENTGLNL